MNRTNATFSPNSLVVGHPFGIIACHILVGTAEGAAFAINFSTGRRILRTVGSKKLDLVFTHIIRVACEFIVIEQ